MNFGMINRFSYAGDLPVSVLDALTPYASKSIDTTTDRVSTGFVGHDDLMDTKLSSGVQFGDQVVVSFRKDERKVPPAVLKKEVRQALEAELKAHRAAEGKAVISKDRRREIRDQTELRLLARTPPVPKLFGIRIDPTRRHVFIDNSSAKVCEEILGVLGQSLGLEEFVPLRPGFLAIDVHGVPDAKVSGLEPTRFPGA